jgi:DNA-binding MarR family transcriptional regulator
MTRRAALDESLLLDNQLCFLVYRLQRGITDLYRPVLADLGLTYPQYLAMLALWEHSTLTVGQLGERLDLDSGTLSPLLKRLEAAGHVVRQRAKDDERSVEVSLTPQGRALRSKARTVPLAVGRCLVGSPEEGELVRAQLVSLLERVEAVQAGAGS